MTALLVAAVGALFSGSMIQAAQDLSGTWVVIPERSTWTKADGHTQHIRVFGERFTAVLTSDDLTIVLEDEGVPRQYLLSIHPRPVSKRCRRRLGGTAHACSSRCVCLS